MTKQKRLKDIMVEKPPLQQATQQDDAAIVAEKKQLEELRQEIANKKAELADTKKQLGETLDAVRTAKSNLEDTKKLLEETFNKVKTITETMQKIIKDSCKMELTFKINDESRKEIQKYEKKATTDFKKPSQHLHHKSQEGERSRPSVADGRHILYVGVPARMVRATRHA